MHLSLTSLLAVSAVVPALAWTPSSTVESDKIYSSSLKKLRAAMSDGSLKTLLASKVLPITNSTILLIDLT